MPELPQPLVGENQDGTYKLTYPTPASDVILEGNIERFVDDYLQGIYGQPPAGGAFSDYLLVNEIPLDWKSFKRTYAKDRTLEDTYNASISYSAEASDFPIFTRDYIVRRANYVRKNKGIALQGLINATVTAAGSGYSFAFVSFSGGTGSGGAAIAIVSAGKVVQLVIMAEGNYTVAPTISITGDGSGATGTIAIQPITALLVKEDYIRQPDSNLDGLYVLVRRIYETLPGPILSGNHVDELTKIIYDYTKQQVLSGTVSGSITGAGVTSLVITNPGTGFTGNPTLTFSAPPSGVTATGTATFSAASPSGKIGSVTFGSGGTGYTSAPLVSINIISGGGSGASITANLVPSTLASVLLTAGGSGYTDAPAVAIADNAGTGSGGLAQAFLIAGTLDTVTVDTPGSGYTVATVALVGGGGTGATATATIGAGTITAISVTGAGTGYTSAPQAVINGDGTGAIAHANLVATSVDHITVTATGSNYGDATATLSGGGGSGAMAGALLAPTAVQSYTLTAAGSGYSVFTTVVSGGGGSGASAVANLATGTVTGVTITNSGSGYVTAPTVTVSGGGGTGAIITAVIGSLTYVEVEPLTAVKDMVMSTTVRLSSIPSTLTVPMSFRVERADVSYTSLIVVGGTGGRVAIGMNETNFQGGTGPVEAFRDEMYMTDSQFAAYIPGVFSITGQSRTFTMHAENIDNNGFPQVWTFRPTAVKLGSTAGIVEISDQKKPYGLRFVTVIRLTQNY